MGAPLVVAIDVFKTVAPVLLGGWIFKRYYDMQLFGQAMSGFFVMLGHCFPVFYKFKGGKGVMAAGAVLIVLDWRLALISWGTFIMITALTKYVSLGAMIGSALFPPAMVVFDVGGVYEILTVTLCTMLLIARHNANIKRLIMGEESKFSVRSGK